jgi:hypothetical protein
MISKHLKDIKKLLKAYHKKYNWEGKPVKKKLKKERRKIMDAFTQAVIIIVIVFIMIEIFKWYR